MAGAARSFWAMAMCLPAIVCLQLMTWVQSGLPSNAGHAIGLDIMGYVVGWLGFALLSFHLAPMFGCGPRWPRFIAAWNWCNVIENLLLVVGGIPGLLGAPPMVERSRADRRHRLGAVDRVVRHASNHSAPTGSRRLSWWCWTS